MSLNLIRDRWIPAVLESGRVERIAPWEITRGEDPPLDIGPPRHDFRLALYEFLIGLVQTACPPKGKRQREQWHLEPPSPEALQAAMEPYAPYFELLGERPLFQQDFALDPVEHAASAIPIGALLINYPGGDSLELFVKRDVGNMCPVCAAMALQTMQAFAPSGGRGNRTSLRGGGPLSTIMLGRDLWQTVWANVLPLNERGVEPAPAVGELPGKVFPWAAPTCTSDKGEIFGRDDGHFLHHYWGMPRRFLLLPEKAHATCDLCGDATGVVVRRFIQRPNGYNYGEDWEHPLTPYRRQGADKPWFTAKGTSHATAYTNWLPLVYGDAKELARPARCVQVSRMDRPDIAGDHGLLAGGYDMDNMKARGWCEGAFPVYFLKEDDLASFRFHIEEMVKAAEEFRSNLQAAVRKAVLDEHNPARAKAFDTAFFSDLTRAFWTDTRAGFLDAAGRLAKTLDNEDATLSLKQGWARVLLNLSEKLFKRAAEVELSHLDHARRSHEALVKMREQNQGVCKKYLGGTIISKEAA